MRFPSRVTAAFVGSDGTLPPKEKLPNPPPDDDDDDDACFGSSFFGAALARAAAAAGFGSSFGAALKLNEKSMLSNLLLVSSTLAPAKPSSSSRDPFGGLYTLVRFPSRVTAAFAGSDGTLPPKEKLPNPPPDDDAGALADLASSSFLGSDALAGALKLNEKSMPARPWKPNNKKLLRNNKGKIRTSFHEPRTVVEQLLQRPRHHALLCLRSAREPQCGCDRGLER